MHYVIADIEKINIVKAELSDPLLKIVNTNKVKKNISNTASGKRLTFKLDKKVL